MSPPSASTDSRSSKSAGEALYGYLGEAENLEYLRRNFFPSKVGGKPAWLIPEKLMEGDTQLFCNKCDTVMMFILQIYAPKEDLSPDSFHRMLYLFGCHTCGKNFKVFRCQLPKLNAYYPAYPLSHNDSPPPLDKYDTNLKMICCNVCGLPTREIVVEENRESGVIREKPKPHKRCYVASKYGFVPASFPERPIIIKNEEMDLFEASSQSAESEDFDDEVSLETKKEPNLLLETKRTKSIDRGAWQKCASSAQIVTHSICHEAKNKSEGCTPIHGHDRFDKSLETISQKFVKCLEANPSHIIRYSDCPLWSNSFPKVSNHDSLEEIKKCEQCGGKRRFEFQIQPSLIYLLNSTRFEYGILAVYSCEKSCSVPGDALVAYAAEVVVREHSDIMVKANTQRYSPIEAKAKGLCLKDAATNFVTSAHTALI